MTNDIIAILPEQVRGRPFQKGRSGNPAGRRPGSRNKATIAAAKLLAGESEGLTRKAVDLGLAGDPMALRLCVERILPVCRERAVKFKLPPIESPADIAPAMKAVTSALAKARSRQARRAGSRGSSILLSGRSRRAISSSACRSSKAGSRTVARRR